MQNLEITKLHPRYIVRLHCRNVTHAHGSQQKSSGNTKKMRKEYNQNGILFKNRDFFNKIMNIEEQTKK